MKKITIAIISVLLILVFVFCGVWTILNFGKIKDGVSKTNIYTSEDLEKAKMDGYNEALTNQKEYEKLINDNRDIISVLEEQLRKKNLEIESLNKDIEAKQRAIADLLSAINQDDAAIAKRIADLNFELSQKQSELSIAQDDTLTIQHYIAVNQRKIDDLNKEIEGLREAAVESNILYAGKVVGKATKYRNHIFGKFLARCANFNYQNCDVDLQTLTFADDNFVGRGFEGCVYRFSRGSGECAVIVYGPSTDFKSSRIEVKISGNVKMMFLRDMTFSIEKH